MRGSVGARALSGREISLTIAGRSRLVLVSASVALACLGGVGAETAHAADAAVRLAGDAPMPLPAAAVARARRVGSDLTITVALKRTCQAAFQEYLARVYDPRSPLY